MVKNGKDEGGVLWEGKGREMERRVLMMEIERNRLKEREKEVLRRVGE